MDDINFTLGRKKTLGLVGESGCGKSTTGRAILRLIEPTSGEIIFEGKDLNTLSKTEMRHMRRYNPSSQRTSNESSILGNCASSIARSCFGEKCVMEYNPSANALWLNKKRIRSWEDVAGKFEESLSSMMFMRGVRGGHMRKPLLDLPQETVEELRKQVEKHL